ncbi:hypothetical protein PAHAL_1G198600 [Panicum hallii]|jgi:hypothetical protein|uniref:Uncharacterized protein n=1 Tax=Panicum hallii TaxID=206008 RepID=A0A2T8KVU5_9POAL|nr:hypothetical protein PAHAL_1G198600 [Panicum hallii]
MRSKGHHHQTIQCLMMFLGLLQVKQGVNQYANMYKGEISETSGVEKIDKVKVKYSLRWKIAHTGLLVFMLQVSIISTMVSKNYWFSVRATPINSGRNM